MKKLLLLLILTIPVIVKVQAQDDLENSKDPELFTRMPNYYISEYKDEDFAKI